MWARGDEDTDEGGGPDHRGTDRRDDLGEGDAQSLVFT